MADANTAEGFDPIRDIHRSGAQLARHTANTVLQMAREHDLSPDSVASALARMADAHRAAGHQLDRAALKVKLQIDVARGRK